jgi:hypothetical protein
MMGRKWTEEEKQVARERSLARRAAAPVAAEVENFAPPQPAPGGVVIEPEIPEAVELDDGRDPAFARFVDGLDTETRAMFSIDEIGEIFAQQKLKAEAEKKAARKKALTEKALHGARIEAGLVPTSSQDERERQDRMAEMVTWRVDLPDEGAGINGLKGIGIDQMIYVDGTTYTTTRAVFETCRDIMYRSWQHESQFQGRSRTYYNRQRGRYEGPGGYASGTQAWHAG